MRHNFYSMRLAREQEPARKSVMQVFATRTPRLSDCACAMRGLAKGNEGDRKIATRRTVRNAMRGPGSAVRGGAFAPSQQRTARLVHFGDACAFDHGRFPLALGKLFGALTVYINAGELFAVSVIDGDLPVLMLAALIARPLGGFGRALLFHVLGTSVRLRLTRQYGNFDSSRQVTILWV